MIYLTLKALHLIAIVAWFAGLFYLPRLFAYHAAASSKDVKEQFKIMEKRLYKIIMNNAMLLTFVFGIGLLWQNPGVAAQGWFQVKLLLLVAMVYYHITCGRFIKKFDKGEPVPSAKFFRLFNEIPTVLLITIIFLATLKLF